ncbi:MAG TPA: tetratricopeptide repeat protein [Mucilaginibacter sp.]|nr:tetratricopeptide repeat protein [Mucilaginibacter sp.]
MKRNTLLFYIILLLAAVTAVYSNHFYNGFHFDDTHSIWNNPNIRSIKNIPHFFVDGSTSSVLPQNQSYRPVTTASLAIDYWLGGGYNLFFFHLSTFILFLAQGVLMLFFFKRLYGDTLPGQNTVYIALFATAWYLLHPAVAETVNYIIARADIQSTLAVVAGFAMYACSPFCKRTYLYLLPVAIGILAKPPAVMFAPIFFFYVLFFEENISLFDVFKRAHLKQLWAAIRKTLPSLIVCGGLYELVSKLTPKTWVPGGNSALHYLITQPYVILHYFITFFWPTGLSADSDWGTLPGITDPRFFIGCLFVLAMFVIAFYTSKKAILRPVSFGILWFFIALAPTSSVIPLAEVLNDHRMFFPFVGLVLSVSWVIGLIVFNFTRNNTFNLAHNKKLLWIPVIILFCACAWGTWKRNNVWHSEESLWRNVTLKSPNNGRGFMNYGLVKLDEGNYAAAQMYFNKALQLLPQYSFIYVNIAVLKDKEGDFTEAEKNYITGLLYGDTYPSHYELYGEFLYRQGRYREAEVMLEQAIRLSYASLPPRKFLMKTYEATGKWDDLKALAQNTLHIAPDDSVARVSLADAMKRKTYADTEADQVKLSPTPARYLQLSLDYYIDKKYEQCIAAAQQALALRPGYAEAWNNIGSAYIAMQQYDRADSALRKAMVLKPNYELAKNNLAQAKKHYTEPKLLVHHSTPEDYLNQSLTYFNYRMYDMCIAACESALDLKPDYDLAYNNLCSAYSKLGEWDKAIEAGNKGLKINPNNTLLKNNLAAAIKGKNSTPPKK